MKKDRIISAFAQLGKIINCLGQNHATKDFELGITPLELENLNSLISRQVHHNGWFSEDMVRKAFFSLAAMLEKEKLEAWAKNYKFNEKPLTVAVIMAGNIPLVGFHDFLCVLLSGNRILCKLSSEDKLLLPALSKILIHLDSDFEGYISFSEGNISNFDAVIATGSTNTSRYFEYYFKDKPSIIRKSRNSVAILNGSETKEQMVALGEDIFRYFGLGCRNVSKIFVPKNYNFDAFFNGMFAQKDVIYYEKYANNYDYNKAVFLMSNFNLLDNEFLIIKEDSSYASPISSLFYEYYDNLEEIKNKLQQDHEQIQCIVSNNLIENSVSFGQTQKPKLWDYADNIDTINFLINL